MNRIRPTQATKNSLTCFRKVFSSREYHSNTRSKRCSSVWSPSNGTTGETKGITNVHRPSECLTTDISSHRLITRRNINGDDADNSTAYIHDRNHFIRGGTPCDPAPAPFRLALWGERSLHTLVLLRHGESQWNSENRYTGWCDVNLTKKGEEEARAAGRLLHENGIEIDHAFTSVLKRASFTTNMALNTARQHYVPVTKTWRLNERHYGALQGYEKDTAYEELGIDQELVMRMRRSYCTRPPVMEDDHPYWHGNDRRYGRMSMEQLERTRAESLEDTANRAMPFFQSVIASSLKSGNRCLVVSHANTLRSLIKQIDNISDEDIKSMTIPTGIPMLYRLDADLRPVDPTTELDLKYMIQPRGYTWATSRATGFHGVYLGDIDRLKDIQEKRDKTNRDWQMIVLRNLFTKAFEESGRTENTDGQETVTTRSLCYEVQSKMQEVEFSNMLMLDRAARNLDDLITKFSRKNITRQEFDSMVNKLHIDAEGHVVKPFQPVCSPESRGRRQEVRFEQMESELSFMY